MCVCVCVFDRFAGYWKLRFPFEFDERKIFLQVSSDSFREIQSGNLLESEIITCGTVGENILNEFSNNNSWEPLRPVVVSLNAELPRRKSGLNAKTKLLSLWGSKKNCDSPPPSSAYFYTFAFSKTGAKWDRECSSENHSHRYEGEIVLQCELRRERWHVDEGESCCSREKEEAGKKVLEMEKTGWKGERNDVGAKWEMAQHHNYDFRKTL